MKPTPTVTVSITMPVSHVKAALVVLNADDGLRTRAADKLQHQKRAPAVAEATEAVAALGTLSRALSGALEAV